MCNANVFMRFLPGHGTSLSSVWLIKFYLCMKDATERSWESAVTEFHEKLSCLISNMELVSLEDECGIKMVCDQYLMSV